MASGMYPPLLTRESIPPGRRFLTREGKTPTNKNQGGFIPPDHPHFAPMLTALRSILDDYAIVGTVKIEILEMCYIMYEMNAKKNIECIRKL